MNDYMQRRLIFLSCGRRDETTKTRANAERNRECITLVFRDRAKSYRAQVRYQKALVERCLPKAALSGENISCINNGVVINRGLYNFCNFVVVVAQLANKSVLAHYGDPNSNNGARTTLLLLRWDDRRSHQTPGRERSKMYSVRDESFTLSINSRNASSSSPSSPRPRRLSAKQISAAHTAAVSSVSSEWLLGSDGCRHDMRSA
jgi:hypothetical protein